MKPTIFEPRIKFKPWLKFFKFGLRSRKIRGHGSLRIVENSGSPWIVENSGSLRIVENSGSLWIVENSGSLWVVENSGPIKCFAWKQFEQCQVSTVCFEKF